MPRFARKLERLLSPHVEPRPANWCDRAFYVPDGLTDLNKVPYAPTEFVSFRPGLRPGDPSNHDLIFIDSAFEIRVCGMSVSRFDPLIPFGRNRNEIVMYSTQKDPGGDVARDIGLDGGDGVPYIHYDHKKEQSLDPDKYYPVADSKSLVVRSGKSHHTESVNVRFNILEVDKKNKDLDRTLMNLDQLGTAIAQISIAVPQLALLSPALSTVGVLGGRALDSHARPDKVLNTDVDFKIAKRNAEYLRRARPAAYLRYGYYVFLSEPVCCKLYLATNTLCNMRLMVKRVRKASRTHQPKRTEYVPLKHCDYIVIRVIEPEDDAIDERASIRMDHVRRLQSLLSTASTAEPNDLKRSITSLMRDIGAQAADSLKD